MNAKVLKVMSNIIDIKVPKEEIRYMLADGCKAIATDYQRLLIVDNVLTNSIKALVEVKKDNDKAKRIYCNTLIEGLCAATEGFKYVDYEKVIIKEEDKTVLDLNYTNENINQLICFIAQLGLTYNVSFIQDLFVSKIKLSITKLVYDRDDMLKPFMLEGTMEGYSFKYIMMPMIQ